MPISIKIAEELHAGDFYEDCAYHPCLCVRTGIGMVEGISLVDGSFPRQCGVPQCGVRKLSFEEAVSWKFFGPPDVPPEIEMTDERKYWLRNQNQAREVWPPKKEEQT